MTICLTKIKETNAAFVYVNIKALNGDNHFTDSYNPILLTVRNFVGETTLIRLAAWSYVSRYQRLDQDAEDYDFWCKCVNHGLFGYHIDETLVAISCANDEGVRR